VEESTIFNRIKEGDVDAYKELFNLYYHPLCHFASKIVNNKERARDLVQDLFLTLYTQRGSLEIHTSVKAYLFRALNNLCLNELRQVKSHIRHHEEIKRVSTELSFEDDVAHAELQSRLRVAVEFLPEQCRRIFQMSRFAGKKNAEIATELGISIRTVETQISKALSILRTQLTDFLSVIVLIAFF
jgi:RNA polymerase sigma-70 factor, ECF subfamily